MTTESKLKILTGTSRLDRQKLSDEDGLELITSLPVLGSKLSTGAKGHFNEIASILIDRKKLYNVDLHLIIMLAEEMATYEKANKELRKKDGYIMSTPKGYKQQTPWVSIRNQSLKNIQDLGALFGMNPLARTKLPVDQPKGGDPLQDLLKIYK